MLGDNTAKAAFCMFELIVAKRIVDKVTKYAYFILVNNFSLIKFQIIVSRLPVGHTHADIDARFGNIWKAAQGRWFKTPQSYRSMIVEVFEDNPLDTDVVDIWVVPDYAKILNDPSVRDK